MELSREAFFETIYASATPGDQLRIQLAPLGGKGAQNYLTSVLAPHLADTDVDNKKMNIYFSAIPRAGEAGEAGMATFIWLDVDGDPIPYEELLAKVRLEPTAVIDSGHGWHVYWCSQTALEARQAVALGNLIALAFPGGDLGVYDTGRNLRVPFTWNAKPKKPLARCELRMLQERYYAPEDLQDAAIAIVLAPFYEPGQRDSILTGLGALLARADYDEGRIARLVKQLVAWAGNDDDNVGKAIHTATKAIGRKEEGKANSARLLLDIIEDKVYKAIVAALGLDSNNGGLSLDGQTIGWLGAIERDMSGYMVEQGDWAAMEGEALFKWNGQFWEAQGFKALKGEVIQVLEATKSLKDGIERPVVYDNKTVVDIASLVEARLVAQSKHELPANLIYFKSGVLDLETREVFPHSKGHWNRWVLDFDYRPDADCPVWKDFLQFAAESDGVVAFLQEWVGYCLTSGNPWQKMLWLHGLSNTGKSTFIKTLQSLLGPAQVSIDPHALREYEVAKLEGALLATCSEVDLGVLRTDRLKALISGDTVNARHPYGQPFSVAFNGKFVWGSNGLPPSSESDGWYRRLDVVSFENRPEKPDMFLHKRLFDERAGILNWAIEGWKREQQYRLDKVWPIPEEVVYATGQYEEEGDTFARFVADSLVADPNAWEPANSLYATYKTWCQQNGHRPLPHSQKFGRELKRFGLSKTGPTSRGGIKGRGWSGARLRAMKVLSPLMDESSVDEMMREAVPLN